MLEVQRYLRAGNSLEKLKSEFGIKSKVHGSLPLVLLDYDQIHSPKTHPIVMECRGLVLELGTFYVVGKPMRRFFNLGEALQITNGFIWNRFIASEKRDGTMILLSHYKGQWILSTRGTFGDVLVGESGKTWEELFWDTVPFKREDLSPGNFYVFELWTLHNHIITAYEKPEAWLLTVYSSAMNRELHPSHLIHEATILGVQTPTIHYEIRTKTDVQAFITQKEFEDPTFEGLVLIDCNGMRLKVKSDTYKQRHYLLGRLSSLSPKNLVPIWLSGQISDIVADAPKAVVDALFACGEKITEAREELWYTWIKYKDIEIQRQFAEKILPLTPFSAILFKLRKQYYPNQDDVNYAVFCEEWDRWGDLILKVLFKEDKVKV